VVHHGGGAREQPLVRHCSDGQHVVTVHLKAGPTGLDHRAHPGAAHGPLDQGRCLVRVARHHAAETEHYRRRSGLEKRHQLRRRIGVR
jgi:hypothetical protein